MKKINELFGNEKIPELKKFLRLMKLTVFFILISVGCVLAGKTYSQTKTLTLHMENSTVKEVLAEIESQSEFRIMYSGKFVDVDREVSLDVKNQKIESVLNTLFAGTDVSYTVRDRFIVLVTPELMVEGMLAVTQQRAVSGKVADSGSQPLPGVTVVVKGTTQGTVTNADGEYTLTNIPEDAMLVFSFVGMRTQEVVVGDQTSINVTMEEDVIGIEEVVAVGYGTRLREELSGSVSSISGEKLNISTETSALGRLQGQVSGVTITTANTPGGSSTIRIRGLGTINDSNPLYIIDGVPSEPSNSLNANDIESISILKDASSAAIYGTRGANGVVIITTKRGTAGQPPAVIFKTRTGVSQAVNQYDLLNTKEYGEVLWMTARNQGFTPGVNWSHPHYGGGTEPRIPDYIMPSGAMEGDPGTNQDEYSYDPYRAIIRANKEGTNWYDEIYRKGIIQEYDLAVSGGGDRATYAISSSYLSEDGLLKHTGFERFGFRTNTDVKVANRFKIGQSMHASLRRPQGDLGDNWEYAPIANAYKLQPIIPVYDIMGNFAGSRPTMMGESLNPVAQLERAKSNKNSSFRVLGNVFVETDILEGLTIKSLFGYDYQQGNNLSRHFPDPERSVPQLIPSVTKESNYSLQWNWANTIDYNTTINDIHRLNVILGTEAIDNTFDWMFGSRDTYFSLDPDYMQLSAGTGQQTNSGTAEEWSLFSIFGRINYSLMGKYIIETTLRRDGSSRFGLSNRYATFPAVSVAWTISEENFMASTNNWLNYLKMRLGWGVSGNDRIGNYNYYSTFGTHLAHSAYDITGSNTSAIVGFQPIALGNQNVTWETTETRNFGLDLRILDNSFNISADIWQRYTSDMLYQVGIPEVKGVATPPFVNIGEMKNIGFDIEAGYNNRAFNNQLKYNVTATISRYKNEIVKLSENIEEEIILGGYRNIAYSRAMPGSSFPEFYGYIVDGIFQTQEEVDGHPSAFGDQGDYNKIGRFKYRDVKPDGVINNDDMTYIGSPHPDFTGGLNVDIGYKNFDLNLFFYGSYGNDMINLVRRNIDFGMFEGNYSKDVLYRSWGSPYLENNEDALLPIHDLSDGSIQPSTAFVEDGSFLRLKNLRIGYSLPNSLISKNLKNFRVYSQVTNLFTITKYSGLDPELNSGGGNLGLDLGAWPTPRQIIFGVEIGL